MASLAVKVSSSEPAVLVLVSRFKNLPVLLSSAPFSAGAWMLAVASAAALHAHWTGTKLYRWGEPPAGFSSLNTAHLSEPCYALLRIVVRCRTFASGFFHGHVESCLVTSSKEDRSNLSSRAQGPALVVDSWIAGLQNVTSKRN